MLDMIATVGRPPMEAHFGENTGEAMRQAALAAVAAGQVISALPLLGRASAYGMAGIDTAGVFATDGLEADFAGDYYRNGLIVQGATPDTLDGWTFARAGAAFVKQAGVLVSAADNVPRLNDDGLLIERPATNRALHSSDRTNAAWTKLAATVSANAANGPDGTATADKLIESVANSTHIVLQTGTATISTTYVYSEFVKAAGRTQVILRENNGSGAYAVFDLTAGTVTSESNAGIGKIEAYADGWFRISLRFTTGGAQTGWNCQARILNASGTESYAGDGTSGLLFWGAQVELGGGASMPIPTTTTTVSRAAEIAKIALETGATGGILVEASPGAAPIGSQANFFDLISFGNRLSIRMNQDRQVFGYLLVGGDESFTNLGIAGAGQTIVVGASWNADGFLFFMNGAVYGPVAVTPPVFDTLGVGAEASSGNFAMGGPISKVASFGDAPAVSDMLAATAGGIEAATRTIRVAAVNSSAKSRADADLICDGIADEVEINAAIAALSLTGGTVLLADGTYTVERTDPLPIAVAPLPQAGVTVRGAVLMTSNDVTLVGQSRHGTVIRLADGQFCNVVRWVGDGIANTAIRSLTIDPNLAANLTPDSTSGGTIWLENCGIKTRTTGSTLNRNIEISDIHVKKSDGLGVYLFGDNVHLRDSTLEAAVHDVAELCSGTSGSITGCTAIIDYGDTSYYAFGTDAFNNFAITNNTVIIRSGGWISSAAHRTWPGNYRGTIMGNTIRCDEGGRLAAAYHAYSFLTTITGNVVQGHTDPGGWGKTRIDLNTSVLFTGNIVSDCAFHTSGDSAGTALPTSAEGVTRIAQNMLEACTAPGAHAQLVFAGNDEFTFS